MRVKHVMRTQLIGSVGRYENTVEAFCFVYECRYSKMIHLDTTISRNCLDPLYKSEYVILL